MQIVIYRGIMINHKSLLLEKGGSDLIVFRNAENKSDILLIINILNKNAMYQMWYYWR